jgi:MinD-like ATPase involved in chromosome partitioning or flagellar assembly
MTTFAICSAKGAPGVTTLAMSFGAVWPSERAVVVAECDPSGGDLAARFSLTTRRGTTTLVLSERHRSDNDLRVGDHAQSLPGGLPVLAGPIGMDAALAVDRELESCALSVLAAPEDIVLDCGRLVSSASGQGQMLSRADLAVVLTNVDVASLAATRAVVERLRLMRRDRPTVLVVVDSLGSRADEAASVLGVPLLGIIPNDGRGAALLRGEPVSTRVSGRAPLLRTSARMVRAALELVSQRADPAADASMDAGSLLETRAHDQASSALGPAEESAIETSSSIDPAQVTAS